MSGNSSRRNFLAAGLAFPAAVSASPGSSRKARPAPAPAERALSAPQYRILGKTGLKVTALGFGCMITSDASVIERAADLGITYFDTARSYQGGNNERMVGTALKNKRKRVVLSTKTEGRTRREALEQLDVSLRVLGTDYVDIWYLHGKDSPGEVSDDLLEAQEIARKAGKARFAGVSTHGGQRELLPWRGYVGQYDFGSAFVVTEESPAAAAALMAKLRIRFTASQPAQVSDEAIQASDKYLGRICIFRKGRFVGGYAKVADGRDPARLAAVPASRLPE